MKRWSRAVLLGAALALDLAAGVAWAADPRVEWDVYDQVERAECRRRPVLLQGSHTDVTVAGPCRYVRVAGEHNDVVVDIRPGGTIEITGAHNDVWWRQRVRGPGPRLVDNGSRNTFHRQIDD